MRGPASCCSSHYFTLSHARKKRPGDYNMNEITAWDEHQIEVPYDQSSQHVLAAESIFRVRGWRQRNSTCDSSVRAAATGREGFDYTWRATFPRADARDLHPAVAVPLHPECKAFFDSLSSLAELTSAPPSCSSSLRYFPAASERLKAASTLALH